MIRRYRWVALQGLISVALLTWIFRGLDRQAFRALFAGLPIWFYLTSLAVVLSGQVLYAWRWWLVLTVTGTGAIHGIDADLHDVGELAPAIAALAALADSPSHLRGIAHIRGHETDRLAALATELTGLGADVTEHDDGLSIRPASLHGGTFHTYADHRMAHAAVVIGSAVDDVLVQDVGTTAKTFPGFENVWAALFAGSAATP